MYAKYYNYLVIRNRIGVGYKKEALIVLQSRLPFYIFLLKFIF